METKIDIVTLNLSGNTLTTVFQIDNKTPELVISKGVTNQLEGNLKNLNFIINYAKEQQSYSNDIDIHAVEPTAKEILNGVVLPSFQEQTKKYIDGTYKESSSFAKALIKTIDKIRKNNSVEFNIDLSKADGMILYNRMKELKAKSAEEYTKKYCHNSDCEFKQKEVKTVAFQNNNLPKKQQKVNAVPDFEKIKEIQKRKQERAERWKDEPFAVEVYNDREEKEPILLAGAKELGNIQSASYLADWWEQVEKRHVLRIGDDLKKLKGINNLSNKSSCLPESIYKGYVFKCKKQHNIVNDIFDVDLDLFLNKTIDLKSIDSEESVALSKKINSIYDIIFSLNDITERFLIKVIEHNNDNWEWDMNEKAYSIEEMMQLQKERNLLVVNDNSELLGQIQPKSPQPNIPVKEPAPVVQEVKPKKKAKFSIMRDRFKNYSEPKQEEQKQSAEPQSAESLFAFKDYDENENKNVTQLSIF